MIEQQMQFHRVFGAAVQRPVKHAGAEFDQGSVEGEQLVLEAEPMTCGDFAAATKQLIEHRTVQLPGTVFRCHKPE